jgi:hypothetical protein
MYYVLLVLIHLLVFIHSSAAYARPASVKLGQIIRIRGGVGLRGIDKSSSLLRLSPIAQDGLATSFCLGAAFVWVQIWVELAKRGFVESKLSRKIIHTSSAPLFMIFWPLFSDGETAKYFAATVPAVQLVRLVSAGLAKQDGNDLVRTSLLCVTAIIWFS